MSTGYEWDTRCANLELSRLQLGFTQYDFINFSRVLFMGFARAEADVHIETGRLAASGHAKINESTADRWSAEISFGGGQVKWAASEFFGYADAHGGYPSHQYFRKLGWLPNPRFGVDGNGNVPWVQSPMRDVPGGTGQGVPIDEDMLGPATSFFSRGRRTPHPELAA
jgi:hypothetical protein